MVEFRFDLPLALSGPEIILSLGRFALGGPGLVRPRLRVKTEDSELRVNHLVQR
jgi:hypothetical protein